jgi:hypothetical protein
MGKDSRFTLGDKLPPFAVPIAYRSDLGKEFNVASIVESSWQRKIN